jgi:hypothetical protein
MSCLVAGVELWARHCIWATISHLQPWLGGMSGWLWSCWGLFVAQEVGQRGVGPFTSTQQLGSQCLTCGAIVVHATPCSTGLGHQHGQLSALGPASSCGCTVLCYFQGHAQVLPRRTPLAPTQFDPKEFKYYVPSIRFPDPLDSMATSLPSHGWGTPQKFRV